MIIHANKGRFLALTFALLLAASGACAAGWSGKVLSVTDGDTVKVLRGVEQVKVRLYGIDAPEKKQEYGQQAKAFTNDLAAGKIVTVEKKAKDRYGRTVGVVTLPDGKALNLQILHAGYAWWYRDYAPKESAYRDAETVAKSEGRGLWADHNPIPPWNWRKSHKARKSL